MTTDGKLKRLIDLPDHAKAYRGKGRRSRVPADPIGLDGFSDTRRAVNGMVTMLCRELVAAGGKTVKGRDLARLLFDREDTRYLRKLVAYARVHKRVPQIVGVAGSGYLWADPKTPAGHAALASAIEAATQMGRCFFFIAALHRRKGVTMSAVQLIFDFMGHVPEGQKRNDELAAMFAAEGTGIGDFLDTLMAHLAKTDAGRAALATAGAKHAQWLITEDARQAMLAKIHEATNALAGLGQTIQSAAPAAPAPAAA